MHSSKIRKNLIRTFFILFQLLVLVGIMLFLLPIQDGTSSWIPGYSLLVVAVIYLFVVALSCNKFYQIEYFLKDRNVKTGETKILHDFMERMQTCYSYDDFFSAISEILEQQGNCSVIYLNCEKNLILYQSPSNLAANEKIIEKLNNNYPVTWNAGFYFFDDECNRLTFSSNARGFFFSTSTTHFFVFCKYTRLFNQDIFGMLFDEFGRFQERMITMNKLTEMERVSHDWHHLDDIKQSYMIPEFQLKNLTMSTHSNSNLDEAGGFSTCMPLSENEVLVIFGDDEVKGLSSLLNMSVMLNTIRIAADKKNLPLITELVLKSLQDLNLKEKNLSLFLGILNLQEKNIVYVNYGIKTAVILDGVENRIIRMPSVCNFISETKELSITPVNQPLSAQNIMLFASNNELCQRPELVRTAMFNVESSAENLISSVTDALEQIDAVQTEKSTLLSIKIGE